MVIHTDASSMNVEPVESTETGQDLDAAGSLQGAFTSLPVDVEPFQSSWRDCPKGSIATVHRDRLCAICWCEDQILDRLVRRTTATVVLSAGTSAEYLPVA